MLRQDYDMDEDSDEVDGTIPDDYNALLLSLLLLLPTFVLVYYLFDCVTSWGAIFYNVSCAMYTLRKL